jgi:hypothetical protein
VIKATNDQPDLDDGEEVAIYEQATRDFLGAAREEIRQTAE